MALRGTAFLALWNDIAAERDREYNCWHTFEHVPERVGIGGFVSGRRYAARERDDDRYFTLYELEGIDVLSAPEYLDVVDRPTEWSSSMRASFRNFLRHPCMTMFTSGQGIAGSIATFRISAQDKLGDAQASALRSSLQASLQTDGVTSTHLGRAGADTRFPVGNTVAAEPPATAHYVLLVEGTGRNELEAAAPRIIDIVQRSFIGSPSIVWNSFDLALIVERADLQHSTAGRQPARPDLKARWST